MSCKRIHKTIKIKRLKIVFDFVSKDCFLGRFGVDRIGMWDPYREVEQSYLIY